MLDANEFANAIKSDPETMKRISPREPGYISLAGGILEYLKSELEVIEPDPTQERRDHACERCEAVMGDMTLAAFQACDGMCEKCSSTLA